MMRFSAWRTAAIGPFLVLLAGCGSEGPRQAISGSVTFKGKALEGKIDFEPTGSEGTQAGTVIANGKYTIPRDKGLVPGNYKVMISSPEGQIEEPDPGGNPLIGQAKDRIPAKYNRKTTLFREVKKGGSNVFDFTLD